MFATVVANRNYHWENRESGGFQIKTDTSVILGVAEQLNKNNPTLFSTQIEIDYELLNLRSP